MKKLALMLSIFLIGSAAYSETRIIRTYQPMPYGNVRPYCHDCHHHYRGQGYYNRYNRPVPTRYNRYNRAGVINRIFNNNNRIIRNSTVSPTTRALERFRSCVDFGFVNVANLKPLKSNDPRLSQIEKSVFGKDYSHQDLNLRLNRLEKSMFNKTNPKMNADERIENLLTNYNNQVKRVPPQVISDLERYIWGRSFGGDTVDVRVSKLEEEIFGAIQQGDLTERINRLEGAMSAELAKNSPVSAPYGTCYGGYVPHTYDYDPHIVDDFNGGNGFSNFFNNLGMIFGGGCPTGWSPQMTPYGQNYYGLQGDGDSEGYVGNTGYAYRNTQRGTGTGIQILD